MILTGTDEHGQKIERVARENGVTPKYVDRIVAGIKELWKTLDISYDHFIRTTDPEHQKTVQKIFKNYMIKGIFTRASMKVGIVLPVNHSGLKFN